MGLKRIIEGDFAWHEGQTWERGDTVFKAVRMTRREALGGRLTVRIMGILAETAGPEGVRVVVWFDS